MWLAGILAGAFVLWCVVVWIRDTNRFVTREYRVVVKGLKKPFQFLLLSDLHNKTYGPGNKRLADAINRIPVDAILVAGDMYTSREHAGFSGAEALFSQIAGKCPIYYANGNHEQKTRVKKEDFGTLYEDYWKRMEKLGIEPLINSRVLLAEYGIDLCGLEIGREYFKRFRKRPLPPKYLEEQLGKRREGVCQILLAHNPDYFPEYADWGADVVLSGHVHGGVVRLPFLGGVLSPALRLFPKYDGGLFREGSSVMILSRGLGMHTIPVRMWNPAELVVVELVPGEKEKM